MPESLFTLLTSPAYLLILAVTVIAGLVRGFAGFGTGMILIPVIAAVYSPQTAVAMVFFIDATAAVPVVLPEVRRAEWKSLAPGFAGFLLLLPAGIYLLKFGDPVALRWALATIILVSVAVLWSGWRYRGPRNKPVALGVGGLAGLSGGACGLPGPPAILYWMASPLDARTVRANTMVFLYLGDIAMGLGMLIAGILTWDALAKAAGAMLFYLAGLLLGTHFFGRSSEATYRRIAFVVILVAAVASLPVLDGVRASR